MIKLRARPDSYRIVLKPLFEGESEILNWEYEREVDHTSDDEFTLYDFGESNNDNELDEVLVLMLSDGKPTPRISKKKN